jgi:broad specificity phosphatase PhoE
MASKSAKRRADKELPESAFKAPREKVNPENLPPPSPSEVISMAKSGVKINRGSSDAMPLSREGLRQAAEAGEKLAKKGGADSITADTSVRGQQTAREIAARDPKQSAVQTDPNLGAWAQGNLEGQPKDLVRHHIQNLIRNNPGHVIPGQGAMTDRHGESFDQFKSRVLRAILGKMHELSQDPTRVILLTGHSSSGNLIKAWIAAGAHDDFRINKKVLNGPPDKPGTVHRIFPDKDGNWEMKPVNLDAPGPLLPGIYEVRHGMTPQNEDRSKKNNAKQEALEQVKRYIRAHDYGRAKASGMKAVQQGLVTEEEVETAVESALPASIHDLNVAQLAAAGVASRDGKKYLDSFRAKSKQMMPNLTPSEQTLLREHARFIHPRNSLKRQER